MARPKSGVDFVFLLKEEQEKQEQPSQNLGNFEITWKDEIQGVI